MMLYNMVIRDTEINTQRTFPLYSLRMQSCVLNKKEINEES